jgi:histidyl-tRNA synthetase
VEGVEREMRSKGISDDALQRLQPLFLLNGSNLEKLEQLQNLLSDSEEGMKGIKELRFVFDQIENLGLKSSVLTLDLTLARGLNYYTGAIFEIKANGVEIGSIGGGGRYDDLTGIFGLKNMSGIGISFGLDRIYLVMDALNLFESKSQSGPEVLFLNFGETEALYGLTAIRQLRNQGIRSELYPDSSKVKRQMTYANKKNIPFVVFVGDQEMERNEYTLKNMNNGQQTACNLKELIRLIASEKS